MEETQVEAKFEIKSFTPESTTFTIREEDHTLGNALRYMIAKRNEVELAAYSIPHPSEPLLNIRVQTLQGGIAIDSFTKSISDLKDMLNHINETYETAKSTFEDSMDFNKN